MNIERIRPQVWNSRAVVHGDLVYLSGLVADDKSLSTKGQTEQVLAKIDDVLAAAGTNKSRILTSTVYLADIDAKDEMNEAWMAGSTRTISRPGPPSAWRSRLGRRWRLWSARRSSPPSRSSRSPHPRHPEPRGKPGQA